MANIVLYPPAFYHARAYGAVGDGITDDTTAITNALGAASAAGGGVVFLPAMHAISSPISVPGNVTLQGGGQGTGVVMKSSFAGATMLSLTGSYASVRDMVLQTPNATYSSNPAADGIQLFGVSACVLQNIWIWNVNGWAVNSSATAGAGNRQMHFVNVFSSKCANGMQMLGVSGSGYVGSHSLLNCNMDAVQSGDCYLIKDIHDVRMVNPLGECTAGTGVGVHCAGALGCFFDNVDFGGYSNNNAQPVIKINDTANNTSKQLTFRGGIVEGGAPGIEIDSNGTGFLFTSLAIYNNQTHGINWTNGGSGVIRDCVFSQNGQHAGTNYDIQSSSTGQILATGCQFSTPFGTGAGQVAGVINDTAHNVGFINNTIQGAGFTETNCYPAGGGPDLIRGLFPFLTGHALVSPTIGASPYTAPKQPRDYVVYITGGTVSDISVGSNSTGRPNGSIFVPAGQSITLTYSAAPTWTWFTAS